MRCNAREAREREGGAEREGGRETEGQREKSDEINEDAVEKKGGERKSVGLNREGGSLLHVESKSPRVNDLRSFN